MKKIVRYAYVLCLLLVIIAVPVMAGENHNYGYQQLNKRQQVVYEEMVSAIENYETTVDLTCIAAITAEELAFINEMLHADHPELFWYYGSISYYMDGRGEVMSVDLFYVMDEEEQKAAKAEFEEQVEKILSSIPEEADTEYEKALYLHDLLVEMIQYQMVGYHQSAYGALVDRTAVCAGYSRAYQHLLHEAGIDSFYVSGGAVDTRTGQYIGSHAWNLVWLDEQCLYIDVTWGDLDEKGCIWHGYFGLTYDEMKDSHTEADVFKGMLPKCKGHDGLDFYTQKSEPGSGVLDEFTMQMTAQDFLDHALLEETDTYASATLSAYCEDASIINLWLQKNGYAVIRKLGFSSAQISCGSSDRELKVFITNGDVADRGCDHKYAKVTVEPTCTEPGSTQYACLICDDSYEETDAQALGHFWSDWESVNDEQHSRSCKRHGCKETEVETHRYEDIKESPDCTTAGTTEYYCKECEHSYEVKGDTSLGHLWSEWSKVSDTRHARSCLREHCTAEEYDDHDFDCTIEDGELKATCTVCVFETAGADATVDGQTVTVHLADRTNGARVLAACYNGNGKMLEAHTTVFTSDEELFTFTTKLEDCMVKVFFLNNSNAPWLKPITK